MTAPNTALMAIDARMSTNLSQREFANLIGVHYSTIAHWETGKKTPSNLSQSLLKLITSDAAGAKAVLGAVPVVSGSE
jgi:DNA-binding transcriptional regulator YiaG